MNDRERRSALGDFCVNGGQAFLQRMWVCRRGRAAGQPDCAGKRSHSCRISAHRGICG